MPTARCRFMVLVGLFACFVTSTAYSQVHVRGYQRKDGTYVQPHYRSAPDGNFANNWSTKGNVNPYTGKFGTRTTPPANYGNAVPVQGYARTGGAFGAPHFGSVPVGIAASELGAEVNNPYFVSTAPAAGTALSATSGVTTAREARPPTTRRTIEEMIVLLERAKNAERLRLAKEFSAAESAVSWTDLSMRMHLAEMLTARGHSADWRKFASVSDMMEIFISLEPAGQSNLAK